MLLPLPPRYRDLRVAFLHHACQQVQAGITVALSSLEELPAEAAVDRANGERLHIKVPVKFASHPDVHILLNYDRKQLFDGSVDGAAITSLTPVMDGPLDPYVTVIEGAGRVLPGKGQLRRVTTFVVPLQPETCCSATTLEWVAGCRVSRPS